ncbi:MAG: superoxide dismutase [Desulfatirhabdiaceae bacterium]
MNRREFFQLSLGMGAVGLINLAAGHLALKNPEPGISLPELPYPSNGLEPWISSRTLEFHHGKHHQSYVDNTVKLIAGTKLKNRPLTDIIQMTHGDPDMIGIFNNAAQSFNHDFYWKSMKSGGGGPPVSENLASAISQSFGDYTGFVRAFKDAAMTQFGSGWAWLVKQGDKLAVIKTSNADTPLPLGMTPLLTIDVWEHAYYLDYQNRRVDYVQAVIDHLINWDFAEANLLNG